LKALKTRVTDVIDHHPPTDVTQLPAGVSICNETIGSCCTLVWRQLRHHFDTNQLPNDLRQLLVGAIVVDTSGGRSWHDDQSAINDLAHDFDHNQLRHQLMEAKYDVTQLSAFDLIRKDAKPATDDVIISSMHLSLEKFQKMNWIESIRRMTSENDIKMWIGLFLQSQDFKPILIFSENEELLQKFSETICSQKSHLILKSSSLPHHSHFRLLRMGFVQATRKQLLPAVVDVITHLCVT